MVDLRFLPVLLVVVVALATQTIGQEYRTNREGIPSRWSVYEFPDPHSMLEEEQLMCGRRNVSSVCDPNSIISTNDANSIDNLINTVYRETTCQCYDCLKNNHGYIIRVAIMPEMERIFQFEDNTPMGVLREARMYSYILSTRWRMDGACNETLLILYARNNGTLYTLTRQHTRLKVSDRDVARVSVAVQHYFEDPDTIADGIKEMIQRYRLIFDDQRDQAFEPSPSRRLNTAG